MSKAEKKLIWFVSITLFLIFNVASNFIIKKEIGVSIYDESYSTIQRDYKKSLSNKKVHPFYGLTDASYPGFDSKISDENNFRSVSPVKSKNPINVLVVGGSVASHLSESRYDIDTNYLFADRLNAYFDTNRFVIYNASFGGGKQPQQYFKLLYLDLLGFKPDLIINYDGFNEIALPIGENLEKNLNLIYPRNFFATLGGSVYDGKCFRLNNKLLSSNTYLPSIELLKWLYIRNCHNKAVFKGLSKKNVSNNPEVNDKKNSIEITKDIWAISSNKISRFAKLNDIIYIHALQPNLHLPQSKPLSEMELKEFNADTPYKMPIEKYYGSLDFSEIDALYKIDQRFLFKSEKRTVYSDKCCHFNKLGMTVIIDDLIINARTAFTNVMDE